MEKIAIECKTEEEFCEVKNSFPIERQGTHRWHEKYNCIAPVSASNNSQIGTQSKRYYEDKGYTIIPASEYLGGYETKFKIGEWDMGIKEGGTMEKVIKLCCNRKCGDYNVSEKNNCEYWEDVERCAYHGGCEPWEENGVEMTKLINKEKNMKENNINKNVLEVFGKTVTGEELDIIDRHYTMDMLERILMAQFAGEIKAACMDAEEKLKDGGE